MLGSLSDVLVLEGRSDVGGRSDILMLWGRSEVLALRGQSNPLMLGCRSDVLALGDRSNIFVYMWSICSPRT